MAEIRTEPVKAVLHEGEEFFDEMSDPLPGMFKYYINKNGSIAGMIYVCPCGCKRTGALDFRNVDGFTERRSWEWDGNREAPTLSPSVHHVGHWHGWLKNGVWTSC